MDRNYITGMILLFVLFIVWYQINAPSAEELERQQFLQDSIAQAQIVVNEEAEQATKEIEREETTPQLDSLRQAQLQSASMGFQPAGKGRGKVQTLENDLMRIEFDENGGQIREVFLKEYDVLLQDSLGNDMRSPVKLMDHPENTFHYEIPLSNGNTLKTNKIKHQITKSGSNSLKLTAKSNAGGSIEQSFTLENGSYMLDYRVSVKNMDQLVDNNSKSIQLNWINNLNKLEKNVQFEKMYSTVYFNEVEEGTDYCACRGDDEEVIENRIKWVSNANQFFSSNLIAESSFVNGEFTTQAREDEESELKTLTTTLSMPITDFDSDNFDMQFYIGPNDFDQLEEIGHDLSDIVPFGWSIFGTINRWIIRPLFKFLSSFVGNMGIVILILTFIVKLLVFPLTYKMLHSQSKMAVLKPVTAGIKEKYKDDMQKQQMESMKIYREYGVNPWAAASP